jgi:hypothetical protein
MIITFEPSPLQTENVLIGKDTFSRFISQGAGTTTIKGYPALPVFQRQVILPSAALGTIEIISKTEELIYLKHKVLPFSLPQKRENGIIENNIAIDSQMYASDKLLPEFFYEKGSDYIYAGISQFDIRFYPVQYNPKTGQVVIINKAVIKITFKDPALKALTGNLSNSHSNQLLTSNSLRLSGKTKSDSIPPTLLIVTHASFYKQAKEFANWKMKSGIKTYIIKTSDISFNPDADKIKAYIVQIHDTFKFDHLLIIGDVSLVPAFYGVGNSLNDHEYSTIQGTDFLPDIAVGRFPVFTATDCKTELQKSMNYERFPDISTGNDWFRNATVAASNEYLDNRHGINMVKFFRNAGFDTIDDLRALIGQFRSDLVQTALTKGRSWMFYIGHGEPNYWQLQDRYSTTSLDYLYNNNMLPVVMSVACYTADLENPNDCLGKKWMSLGEKRGAVSFIGATELTEFFYSDTLGEYAIFGYFNRSALTIGAALNYGKMQMYNFFQGGAGSVTEATMQQFLLLGDPTVMPWTNIPSLLQTNLKKYLKPKPQIINVKVTSDDIPVVNALVCLSTKNFSYYQTTYTDSSGNVSFNVNPDSSTIYYVTITGYNIVTLEDSILFDTIKINPPIDTVYDSKFIIYPNPLSKFCTISSHTRGRYINNVDVMDLSGRIIASYKNIHSYNFILSKNELQSGIYLLRIMDSNGIFLLKRIAVI